MENPIKKISSGTLELMKKKSMLALPNNPSEQGVSPNTIKQYLTAPMFGETNSLVAEINRIVDEINSKFGLETEEKILELKVDENGNLVLVSTEKLPVITAETFNDVLDEINTVLEEISEVGLETDPSYIPANYTISYNSDTDILTLTNTSTGTTHNTPLKINEKINELKEILNGKANSSSLNTTNTRVSTLEAKYNILSDKVEDLENNAGGGTGGTSVTVDTSLSTTSTNPVQNKVITEKMNSMQSSINEFEETVEKVDQLENSLLENTFYSGLENSWANKEKIGTFFVGENIQYPVYVNKDADTASQLRLKDFAQGKKFPSLSGGGISVSDLFSNNNYRRYNGYLVTLGITTKDGKYTGRKITILLSALTETPYYYNNFNPDYEISFDLQCSVDGNFILNKASSNISQIDIVNIRGV